VVVVGSGCCGVGVVRISSGKQVKVVITAHVVLRSRVSATPRVKYLLPADELTNRSRKYNGASLSGSNGMMRGSDWK
jgi:hypothetical protein